MRKVLTSARRHWRLRSATAVAAVGAMTVSLGVVLLGAATVQVNADEPCVPQDAWTETIDHPAVTHTETATVVDQAAWTEVVPAVPAITERRWLVWTGGPTDVAPPVSAPLGPGGWNTPSGEPNGVPHQQPDGVPYQVGNGGGDWFMWLSVEVVPGHPQQIIEHPAVTHTDTKTVVDTAAWTEFIYHPAVTCEPETETKDVCPNIEGDQATVPDGYQLEDGDCVQIAGEETIIPKPKPEKPKPVAEPDKEPTVKGVEVVAPPVAAPTAVAAGLAGDTGLATGQLLGQGLAGLGLVLLVAAGWLGAPRLTRGAHQS